MNVWALRVFPKGIVWALYGHCMGTVWALAKSACGDRLVTTRLHVQTSRNNDDCRIGQLAIGDVLRHGY